MWTKREANQILHMYQQIYITEGLCLKKDMKKISAQ